jgi:hypothetical protein
MESSIWSAWLSSSALSFRFSVFASNAVDVMQAQRTAFDAMKGHKKNVVRSGVVAGSIMLPRHT